jgi:hypothetical protein
MPRCIIYQQKKWVPLYCRHLFHTHFRVCVMFIIKVGTVTLKCRTVIKALFLYFNLCLSIMLDSLSCSFTSISFLTIPNYKTLLTRRFTVCIIHILSYYSGTCLIQHTKEPQKYVELYRMSEYSGFILVNRNTLGPQIFVSCKSQDVGKLRCLIPM